MLVSIKDVVSLVSMRGSALNDGAPPVHVLPDQLFMGSQFTHAHNYTIDADFGDIKFMLDRWRGAVLAQRSSLRIIPTTPYCTYSSAGVGQLSACPTQGAVSARLRGRSMQ